MHEKMTFSVILKASPMTPKSRDHMPTMSLWGVTAKWPTRAPKTKHTLHERPTRIQPYQFEPVRQDFERVPEHRVTQETAITSLSRYLRIFSSAAKYSSCLIPPHVYK